MKQIKNRTTDSTTGITHGCEKYIKWIGRLLLISFIAILSFPAKAQEPVDGATAREILALVVENRQSWEKVELNGKLKSDRLPISPSVKIYMERGRRLEISLRAPFFGEVGRIQATPDTIIAVNKMKKTYWSDSMEAVDKICPGGLEMLQSILLGRITMLGAGEIDYETENKLNFCPDGEDGWLIMPKQEYQPEEARYGYVVGSEGETLALIVERVASEDFVEVDYEWKNKGKYDLLLMIGIGGKNIEATLQFDTPKTEALPMNPIAIDSRYRKTGFKEFITKLM